MDQLVAYSDEDDDAPSKGAPADLKAAATETHNAREDKTEAVVDPESAQPGLPTTKDLAWLAPPSKRSRNAAGGTSVFDTEWGLGSEKRGDGDEQVDPALEAKLAHFHQLKAQGTHFNESLARNRSFRNPHIYAKLVEWVEVDETASAFDGMVRGGRHEADCAWRASSSARREMMREGGAERLAALQKKRQEEAEEAKARGRRSNIDFVTTNESSKQKNKHTSTSQLDAVALAKQRADAIRQDLSLRDPSLQQHGSSSRQRDSLDPDRRNHRHHRDSERKHERDRSGDAERQRSSHRSRTSRS